MKVTVPAKEIELCDVCHRDSSWLVTCLFCGNRYCLTCEAIISGCIHKVRVCRKCGENETVLAIVEKHAPLIRSVLEARDIELRKSAQPNVQADELMPEQAAEYNRQYEHIRANIDSAKSARR